MRGYIYKRRPTGIVYAEEPKKGTETYFTIAIGLLVVVMALLLHRTTTISPTIDKCLVWGIAVAGFIIIDLCVTYAMFHQCSRTDAYLLLVLAILMICVIGKQIDTVAPIDLFPAIAGIFIWIKLMRPALKDWLEKIKGVGK